jgi:hypothetical protein
MFSKMVFMSLINTNSQLLSLERNLQNEVCIEFGASMPHPNDEFLSPNEGSPERIAPLLAGMNHGVLVAPGTYRLFFDAGLAPLEKCIGFVGRDINPNAKKINDFIMLLWRLSPSAQDMHYLTTPPANAEAKNSRFREISRRMVADQIMPLFMKEYYSLNYRDFGELFYSLNQWWMQSRTYEEVKLFENEILFQRIRQYIVAGKIVSTVGDINDLAFLQDYPIGMVDASNIHRSTFIDLHGSQFVNPVPVIWTDQHNFYTTYHSFLFQKLNDEEREELKGMHTDLQKALHKSANFAKDLHDRLENPAWARIYRPSPSVLWASYSQAALLSLREYRKECFYEFPDFGFVDMENGIWMLKEIPAHVINTAIKDPKFERFASFLAWAWWQVGFPLNLDLMEVPGWKEAFEKYVKGTYIFLKEVQRAAESCGCWQTFIDRFGKERLDKLRR